MAGDGNAPVTVRIMDREFRVACPAEEEEALRASADLLTARMREVRDSGKVFGADRIAIMAALNLTHELLQQRNEYTQQGDDFTRRIESLQNRIEHALRDTQQMDV